MIVLLFTHLLGAYLALLLGFNKGFTYNFFWVGPVPLFVSEFVLLVMTALFAVQVVRGKWRPEKRDRWLYAAFGVYWSAGLIALFPVLSQKGPDVLDTLKRSALCYYSLFAFLSYALVPDQKTVRKLLCWMFVGGTVCMVASGLTYFSVSWWPRYALAGVASLTAFAYVALYGFTQHDDRFVWVVRSIGAIAATFVIYTTIRSGIIAIALTSLTILFIGLVCGVPKHFLKHAMLFGLLFIVTTGISVMIFGEPQGFGRYTRLFRIQRIVSSATPAVKLAPPSEPVVTPSADPVVPIPGPAPVKSDPVIPAPVKVEPVQITQTVSPAMVTQKDVPASAVAPVDFTPEKLHMVHFKRFREKILKALAPNVEAGNVSWRLTVWFDGLEQVLERNIFIGIGFDEPLIAWSMNPFQDPERRIRAIDEMKKTYEFKNRISNAYRNPSDDVVPRPPFVMTQEEISRIVSQHWYGIDFHNSHLAILFRMGLLGLGGFLLLNLVFVSRLWGHCRRKDMIAVFALAFWVWYMVIAAFNVPLEGPFLGVPFWLFLGLLLRYVKEQKNT